MKCCTLADIGGIAIVHDYVTQMGGAERLVLRLSDMFPDAPVFTAVYDPSGTYGEFASRDVRTRALGAMIRPESFRRYAPLYPLLFATLDLRRYDTVIVSSSAFAHHVRHRRAFVYCHTPPRFLYQPASYSMSTAARLAAEIPIRVGRAFDRRAARRAHSYAVNSLVTQQRVREYYRRDAALIHPPVSTAHLPEAIPALPSRPRALVVSRLLPYKNVDLAVLAATRAGIPLTVVGEGPERARLERLGGPGVEFLGRVNDKEMAALFISASVILAPGDEDFGFAPVEAHWAGRPVVALGSGGAVETVSDGIDGILVGGVDVDLWVAALRSVHDRPWDPAALRNAAMPFSVEVFERRIRRWLAEESGDG